MYRYTLNLLFMCGMEAGVALGTLPLSDSGGKSGGQEGELPSPPPPAISTIGNRRNTLCLHSQPHLPHPPLGSLGIGPVGLLVPGTPD